MKQSVTWRIVGYSNKRCLARIVLDMHSLPPDNAFLVELLILVFHPFIVIRSPCMTEMIAAHDCSSALAAARNIAYTDCI